MRDDQGYQGGLPLSRVCQHMAGQSHQQAQLFQCSHNVLLLPCMGRSTPRSHQQLCNKKTGSDGKGSEQFCCRHPADPGCVF